MNQVLRYIKFTETSLNISYQPAVSFAGIPIKREPINPRHVAICVKLEKVPLIKAGEICK